MMIGIARPEAEAVNETIGEFETERFAVELFACVLIAYVLDDVVEGRGLHVVVFERVID